MKNILKREYGSASLYALISILILLFRYTSKTKNNIYIKLI